MSRLDAALAKLDGAQLPDIDYGEYARTRQTEKEKVKHPIAFGEEIIDILHGGEEMKGAKMPWVKTHQLFRFRPGEVTMWSGYNGHKKSMVLGYMALGFMKQNEPVAIASFEMKPASTLIRMMKQFKGSPDLTEECISDFMVWANKQLWLYDQQGGVTAETLYGVIYYCAEELGVRHFVIDSLMRVIPSEDDYNAQKNFVTRLCAIAIECNIHIHLVHHTKKGKESEVSGRYDAKGSGAISDNIHNSLIVWSNKEENPDQPDVIVKCDKQREGQWEGTISLYFIEDCLQFSGSPDRQSRSWQHSHHDHY